jgi:methylenetetrahydrofolate reductase (NADPH)
MKFFRELSLNTSFPICYNLLPHYAAEGQEYNALAKFVMEALDDGRIRTFYLSDSPVCHQEFSSLQLAENILAAGGEPIVSLALNVNDRNGVITKLQEYCQVGVRQFLFVSGDYPVKADNKRHKPVFDIDSVQFLMLLADFQTKWDIAKGCAVSPFKALEGEQVWQYEKLRRKISVGADFIVTQLGYDIRKFDELIKFCEQHDIKVPLMANIRIADTQTARLIQVKDIPGVKLPDFSYRTPHEEASGSQGALERTAKFLAVLKGVGFHGAMIGNHSSDFSAVKQVLDKAETLQPQWQSFLGQLDFFGTESSFYYFQKDQRTGLNSNETAPLALKHFPSPAYSFSYFVDWLVYVPHGPLFKLTGRFCHFCNTRKPWYAFLWLLEYLSKGLLYGCKMCGDCTLYACGFLCYQSGCPKKMLNGPCGGSIDGYCEVFPEKKRCYWGKVYHNMKGVRQHVTFVTPPIPARDTSLQRTSSWINFFLGKDHRKMKFDDCQGRTPQ